MPSEIKQLLERIEEEQLAAYRGLTSYAVVSRHDFINTRQKNIDTSYKRLSVLVGEEVATSLTVELCNCAYLLYQKEQWIAQVRQEQLEREQIEIENARATVQYPTPFHRLIHRKLHGSAQIGDTLIYKLRPSAQPRDSDRLWRGKIKHILTDCYNKRDYFVESLDYPGTHELVYSGQVYDFQPADRPED